MQINIWRIYFHLNAPEDYNLLKLQVWKLVLFTSASLTWINTESKNFKCLLTLDFYQDKTVLNNDFCSIIWNLNEGYLMFLDCIPPLKHEWQILSITGTKWHITAQKSVIESLIGITFYSVELCNYLEEISFLCMKTSLW